MFTVMGVPNSTLLSHATMQASGGHDRVIHVWDVRSNLHLHTFTGHRDTVSVSHMHMPQRVYLMSLC